MNSYHIINNNWKRLESRSKTILLKENINISLGSLGPGSGLSMMSPFKKQQ